MFDKLANHQSSVSSSSSSVSSSSTPVIKNSDNFSCCERQFVVLDGLKVI